MKKTILALIFLISVVQAVNFTDFINKKNCNQIIDKKVFTICYDYKMKGARFVAYTLNGSLVNKHNVKKRPRFYTEKNLAKKYRSHTKDYVRTGYDRGHLANDASFDYNKNSQKKTYTMANIIPQVPKVNRKTWIKVEKLERKIAVKFGTVSVINGVIYNSNPKRIGKNKIAVPSGFWKMIFNDSKGYKKCFYYKNDKNINVRKDKFKHHLISCKKVMKL
jgi:endonuclease G, mitochondrial